VQNNGESEGHFIMGGRKSIVMLESSQNSPARPSDRLRVKVKMLWLL
jgi:hypothetical protein